MTDRWLPASEADLEAALQDGRLDEGPYLDFKRELPEGKKGNAELARDLAMFANDGGTLVFGIAEPQRGRYELAPVRLDQLRERVEQVASSRLDPPLHVTTTTMPSTNHPGRGYVFVRIPASAGAPHMVDDRYFGRVGTTRAVLSDRQVRAIIASRQAAIRPILELVDADIARDPIPPDQRSHAHLHVVAHPRFARSDLVLADVRRAGDNWSHWFLKELLADPFDPPLGSWAPDLKNQASGVGLRANGAALFSHYVGQDRGCAELLKDPEQLHRYENDLLDLEIDEDGTLHLYCGRGTDTYRDRGEVVIPQVVAGLVLRTIAVAARLSRRTGYVGTWDFGIAITDLRGAVPWTRGFADATPAYSAELYRHATAADDAELAAVPRGCAERLIGRLLRSLGHHDGLDAVFPTG